MKVKVVIAALAAFLCLAATAQAFVWHLGYGQAKHATKEFAEESCRIDRKCVDYRVGPCKRRSESGVDCVVSFLYTGVVEPGDKAACALILHWGVNRNGELALKKHGKPKCARIEPEPEPEPGIR